MKISSLFLLISVGLPCPAQQNDCYQKFWTKSIAKKVPASICIKRGEIIYQLFSEFDFNQDGLSDMAIKVGKEEKVDGDTIALKVFKQQIDSTFTEFAVLDNVFPIYFDKYALDYKIQDQRLLEIKNRYQETYPLERIEINNNEIHIYMVADATATFHLTYSYSFSKEDWLLTQLLVNDEESREPSTYETFRIGNSIRDFNYFEYMEGNF